MRKGGAQKPKAESVEMCAQSLKVCLYRIGFKKSSWWFGSLQVKNKSVSIFVVPEAESRCRVFLLDLYFSKLPKTAFERDVFYLQPVSKVSLGFTTAPVGNLGKHGEGGVY